MTIIEKTSCTKGLHFYPIGIKVTEGNDCYVATTQNCLYCNKIKIVKINKTK
jgi:hypothetical protein